MLLCVQFCDTKKGSRVVYSLLFLAAASIGWWRPVARGATMAATTTRVAHDSKLVSIFSPVLFRTSIVAPERIWGDASRRCGGLGGRALEGSFLAMPQVYRDANRLLPVHFFRSLSEATREAPESGQCHSLGLGWRLTSLRT